MPAPNPNPESLPSSINSFLLFLLLNSNSAHYLPLWFFLHCTYKCQDLWALLNHTRFLHNTSCTAIALLLKPLLLLRLLLLLQVLGVFTKLKTICNPTRSDPGVALDMCLGLLSVGSSLALRWFRLLALKVSGSCPEILCSNESQISWGGRQLWSSAKKDLLQSPVSWIFISMLR